MAPVRPCSRWPRRLCRPQPASQCLGRGTSRRQRWRPGPGHLCSTASDSRHTSGRCAAHLSPWKRADSTDAPLRTRDARMDFVPTLLQSLVGDFRACPCRASEADDVGRGFPDGAQREIGVVHAAGQDHGEMRKDRRPCTEKGIWTPACMIDQHRRTAGPRKSTGPRSRKENAKKNRPGGPMSPSAFTGPREGALIRNAAAGWRRCASPARQAAWRHRLGRSRFPPRWPAVRLPTSGRRRASTRAPAAGRSRRSRSPGT